MRAWKQGGRGQLKGAPSADIVEHVGADLVLGVGQLIECVVHLYAKEGHLIHGPPLDAA